MVAKVVYNSMQNVVRFQKYGDPFQFFRRPLYFNFRHFLNFILEKAVYEDNNYFEEGIYFAQ